MSYQLSATPALPGTARHTVPVSCREGRCAPERSAGRLAPQGRGLWPGRVQVSAFSNQLAPSGAGSYPG